MKISDYFERKVGRASIDWDAVLGCHGTNLDYMTKSRWVP